MRETIRLALVAGVPQVGGKVFEAAALNQATDKAPFLMVQMGAYTLEGTWQGVATVVDVWVYMPEGDLSLTDAVVDAVKATLHNKRFTDADGTQFFTQYTGSPAADQTDPDWDANVRPVRFYAYNLAWMTAATFQPGPVETLQSWVQYTLPNVGYDPATWDPDNPTPAVYWRMESLDAIEPTIWGAKYTASIAGHVLVPAAFPAHVWIRIVVERLGVERLRVVMSNGTPMYLTDLRADFEGDPFRAGQISATVMYGLTCEEVFAIDEYYTTHPPPWSGPIPPLPPAPVAHHIHVALDGMTTEVILP